MKIFDEYVCIRYLFELIECKIFLIYHVNFNIEEHVQHLQKDKMLR